MAKGHLGLDFTSFESMGRSYKTCSGSLLGSTLAEDSTKEAPSAAVAIVCCLERTKMVSSWIGHWHILPEANFQKNRCQVKISVKPIVQPAGFVRTA